MPQSHPETKEQPKKAPKRTQQDGRKRQVKKQVRRQKHMPENQEKIAREQRLRLEQPSKQIRLLYSIGAVSESYDELRFQLKKHNLIDSASPGYNAISYAWGDAEMASIWIDGEQVSVRQSCKDALWQATKRYPNTPIWIDSVCINQNDPHEKSAQVMVMGEIFSSAAQVLVCIGDASQDVLRLVDKPISELTGREANHDYSLRRVLMDIMTRPLWDRLWVVQEIALAQQKVLLVGNEAVNWDKLLHLEYLASYAKSQNLISRDPRDYRRDYKVVQQRKPTLMALIYQFKEHLCQDPRDHLWALLRLWQIASGAEHISEELRPDYRISAFELVTRIIAHEKDNPQLDVDVLLGIFCKDTETAGAGQAVAKRQHDESHVALSIPPS